MRKNLILAAFVSVIVLSLQSNGFARHEAIPCNSISADSALEVASGTIVDIGSRLELFVDDYLIEKLSSKAKLRLHHPVPKEISIVHDAPWEGSGCGNHCIFKDGNLYRMYYAAWQLNGTRLEKKKSYTDNFCTYAESDDGINWRKPELGLIDFEGSKSNNIVLATTKFGKANTRTNLPGMFRDQNPAAESDAQYKGIIPTQPVYGFIPFKSVDGIHWTNMTNEPITTGDSFDSQNIAFWDCIREEYRAYWRSNFEGVRSITTGTSKDFLHWKNFEPLRYFDAPPMALYNSCIIPYYRAPHIFIGFPFRYVNRGWSESMASLPEREHRELRALGSERHGTVLTEGLLMASRDGVQFKRWDEAFLRPGIERVGTWNYGHQAIGWSIVETRSDLEGAPDELSLYAVESYWTGTDTYLRRYTLRIDGFVSVNAPMSGGELVTRPLVFTGSKLVLNFSSSAAGGIQVEIQDETGRPLPGFTIDDCPPVFGDTLERVVTWKNGSDLSVLKGKPVKLRFVLKDADLFSLRFK